MEEDEEGWIDELIDKWMGWEVDGWMDGWLWRHPQL